MKTKNVLIGLGVVALLVLGVMFPRGNSVVQQIVGANAGPTVYNHQYFLAGITTGGVVSTTTGAIAAYTTSEKDFVQVPSVINWNPSLAQTVTITATSTFPLIPNVGDVATVLINNASTSAATITWAAGSGLTLTASEDDGGNTTAYTAWARFTLIRTSTLTVDAIQENLP